VACDVRRATPPLAPLCLTCLPTAHTRMHTYNKREVHTHTHTHVYTHKLTRKHTHTSTHKHTRSDFTCASSSLMRLPAPTRSAILHDSCCVSLRYLTRLSLSPRTHTSFDHTFHLVSNTHVLHQQMIKPSSMNQLTCFPAHPAWQTELHRAQTSSNLALSLTRSSCP
jgi:hypothetical protein